MEESDIKFSVMVSLFNWMQKSKSSAMKRSKFRKFLDAFCRKPGDYFSAIRLILPALDRERGSYGLKEHALATCLIDALGMSRDSPDAQRLLNWRKGGPKTGASAGNFSLVASEVLQRRQGLTSGGLTLKKVNDLLDRLALSENRGEKTSVLSDLIKETNAHEMKWIIMIILKDLKLGTSEKSIFHEFHPDAEDLFNVTCDLKLVCEKLRNRSERHKRQDIEVGKPVRPQLALRVSNVGAAWKKLHGKEVVVECKFDGDRIQLHKNNSEIHFFSRNFLPHPEYEHAMADIIANNILVDRCILDGEMLVWDTSENRFADFGSNQEIAKATREGLDSDRQLCYVAFDILYAGDTSVIHQSLSERHDLLSKVVKPIKGRFEILVPDGDLNENRQSEDSRRSFVARGVEEVEKFFKQTVENRDEGIILKDLGSKWEPGDRSGKWLKLKPEYLRAGADLDVLIIGGYYGSGRHGGKVAQFLVGLAERPLPNAHPRRFISFCRVGTGLSEEELEAVVSKLKPYFREYEYPKKAPPSFYQVTNNSKERPDVWVESPEKSIIVSITSDIRTIKSEVFAAPYSLRFPRIDRARFDKPWYECLDVQSFVELVHSSNGTTQRGQAFDDVQDHKPKRVKSSRKVERNASSVPSHFVQTDVSSVKSETLIFLKMVFYFANVPSTHSLELLHKMVVENGGNFSMNLNNSVTHCIAAESRGIKFQAAKLNGDVIHYSWLLDCCLQKKLLPLQPKYFLHLSEPSKVKLQEEIDENSDSYFVDVDAADLKQLLSNTDPTQCPLRIDHYQKKYCPKEKWSHFQDCSFYFKLPPHSSMDSERKVLLELALRRMKVGVSFSGGRVIRDLTEATHVVVLSLYESSADFSKVLSWFPEGEKRLLLSRRIQVVACQWVEDCLEREQRVPEDSYSLKPVNVQNLVFEVDKDELNLDSSPTLDGEGLSTSQSGKAGSLSSHGSPNKTRLVTLLRETKTKRGQSSRTGANKRIALTSQLRRVRARIGNKPAKIHESESDGTVSPDNSGSRNIEVQAEKDESCEITGKQNRGKILSNQPRRVTRVGNKPVRIHDGESGGSLSPDHMNSNKEDEVQAGNGEACEITGKGRAEIQDMLVMEDLEASNKLKAVEPDPSEHPPHQAQRIGSVAEEHNTREQITDDPVQAMLLQMMPSLGSSRAGSTNHCPIDEKLPTEVANKDVSFVAERPALDTIPKPEKKKKVSYKDVAEQLLKDW